jgi:hypothetical protein
MTTKGLPESLSDDTQSVILLESAIRRIERLEDSQSTLTELQVSLNLLSDSFQEVKCGVKEVGFDLKLVKEDVSNIKFNCDAFEDRIAKVEKTQKDTEDFSKKELMANLEKAKNAISETEKTNRQKRNDLIKAIGTPIITFIIGAIATWLRLK